MVNPKELQKFLDLWGPVIAVLPSVINATEREEELARHIVALEAQLVQVKADTEANLAERAAKVAAADQMLASLKDQRVQAAAEVKVAQAEAKAEVASAKKEAEAKIKVLEASTVNAQAKLRAAQGELNAKLAEQAAAFAEQATTLQADIDELERKRAQAESALAELRFKLG